MKEMNFFDLLDDFMKESEEDRYDYKRFQPCDRKFLRFMGISNAKE